MELVDIRSRMLHMSYVDFLVCKRCFRCWLCDFLFSRQNGAERKQRPIFTFFLPLFSSHSVRHRLPLLGYPLSGKSTRHLSNYKKKNYWIYKLSIYFLDLIRRAFMYRLLDDRQFRMHGLGRSSSVTNLSIRITSRSFLQPL